MENSFYTNALIEFYQNHKTTLVNSDEVLKIANNEFLSNFCGANRKSTEDVCKNENVIFAFKEGILFTPDKFYIFDMALRKVQSFHIDEFKTLEASHKKIFKSGSLTVNGIEYTREALHKFNIDLYEKLKLKLEFAKQEYFQKIDNQLRLENEALEKKRSDLVNNQEKILSELNKKGNNEIDLINNDFNKLLNKNQKIIIEVDKNYIHQFIKVSNFIKTKKQNTQKIFESIRDTSSQEELEERVSLLKNQIYSYELLVFHSLNMIGALVTEDLITFYEIYESFDKLGIFNSNWENEVSDKLTNIGSKLDDLMYSIYNMEQNIVNELSNLSYITQDSFEDLNRSVTSQLKEVESSINTNNLLTGIQTYQLYKINKNTKGIGQ